MSAEVLSPQRDIRSSTPERFGMEMKRGVAGYELSFDAQKYQALDVLHLQDPQEYERQMENQQKETYWNLRTHVGERFNVLLSSGTYDIREGRVYGQNLDEPFMNVLKRGQEYLKEHNDPVDHPREEAEIVGFAKIEKVLCDPNTPAGTMMLSVSPRGGEQSIYKHNFYDIFTIQERDGTRSIESRRYSSKLGRAESAEMIRQLRPDIAISEDPTDVEFLSNPVRIDPDNRFCKTADAVHDYFHREHEYMSEEEFNEIIRTITPLIIAYINTLANDPSNKTQQGKIFNAMLNTADDVKDAQEQKRKGVFYIGYDTTPGLLASAAFIDAQAARQVREVMTACGYSGGAGQDILQVSVIGAFGVADFSGAGLMNRFDTLGDRVIQCPSCNQLQVRPTNETIQVCGLCRSTEIAC